MAAFNDLHDELIVAIYNMVHDYDDGNRRGAVALAPRLGMAPGTLSNKVAPDNEQHLSPQQLLAAMLASEDFTPLEIAAHRCGYVALMLPHVEHLSDTELLKTWLDATAEFGDLARVIDESLADSEVTAEELRRIEKELRESVAAQFQIVARMRYLVDGAEG